MQKCRSLVAYHFILVNMPMIFVNNLHCPIISQFHISNDNSTLLLKIFVPRYASQFILLISSGNRRSYAKPCNRNPCFGQSLPIGSISISTHWLCRHFDANIICLNLDNGITVTSQWALWCIKSTASRLFTQPFVQTNIKEKFKAPRHWPLRGRFTGDRWIPCTKG